MRNRSVQLSSVQSTTTLPSSRLSASTRLHARMHACTGSRQLALRNDAQPRSSVHRSPQPPPFAAASPVMESPFDGLSHAVKDAQQLLLLPVQHRAKGQQGNPAAAQQLQTAVAARIDSCEALQLQHRS